MRPRSAGVLVAVLVWLPCVCVAQYPEVNYRLPEASGQEYLTGNWNGARTDLAERGIVLDFESTNDNMWVLHGGASNQGTGWERIRGTLDINFSRLTGWRGVKFHATALWQTGNNIGDKLGSLANPSSIDSVHVFRMDSYWVEDTLSTTASPCASAKWPAGTTTATRNMAQTS